MSKREKLLLVDDDIDLVAALRLILEKDGYTVVAAHDAESGLARADAERPDLILLDVMMPNATEGFRFIWKLRAGPEPYFQRVPIIMLTAIQERTGLRFYPETSDGPFKAGEPVPVQDFLDKPIDPAKLLDRVQSVLTAAWRKG
ncbi:MAG: PleD family two-component system response regulator [Thermoanaerobaculales bacterium]